MAVAMLGAHLKLSQIASNRRYAIIAERSRIAHADHDHAFAGPLRLTNDPSKSIVELKNGGHPWSESRGELLRAERGRRSGGPQSEHQDENQGAWQ
jgi:hypothetical protein